MASDEASANEDQVKVVEVGPRDGLQNEASILATADKVELVERLVSAGIGAVEATSFVRPDRIPQLSDGAQVFPAIEKVAGVRYIALVPNLRGLESAREAGVTEMAVFAAASEAFNRSNLGRGTEESLAMFAEVAREGLALGMTVRGYVSTVLGCPFQGEVPLAEVFRVLEAMDQMGCDEISLGDTIGVGRPAGVVELVRGASEVVDISRVAVHFHDTYGMGLSNSMAAIGEGVRTVDTSIGGLGGCPFAGPGAKGNLATEDLVYALAESDHDTGADLDSLVATNKWLAEKIGRPLPSRSAAALQAKAE
ncbi:MAG TPA: hydroxymethylglutaryl-CoA lyase [Microthrixaceae bacterium]|nr:hydroxymethylglutaryl-CoA lyase [Microthrixaceae bacterium]